MDGNGVSGLACVVNGRFGWPNERVALPRFRLIRFERTLSLEERARQRALAKARELLRGASSIPSEAGASPQPSGPE